MMTRGRKITVWVVGMLLLVAAAVYFSPPAQFVRGMLVQMRAGKKVMDSLTEKDIQDWIARADHLLAEHASDSNGFQNVPVPSELKKLGILRIDASPPDRVAFMWVGGMDHTGLIIQRGSNGAHTVTACYDDEHQRQLWPK